MVGGKRKNARRTRIEYLTCWQGYGREHDTWEPAEMLEDTQALEVYLQGLVKSKKELPPSDLPQPGSRKRAASPVATSSVKRGRFADLPQEERN